MFVAIFLPITISAGFWQLQRATEKEQILASQQAMQEAPRQDFSNLSMAEEHQYRRVTVSGERKLEQVFLVDNKVRSGRIGYEILFPLQVVVAQENYWLIVNRGWIGAGLDRSVLPAIPPLDTELQLTGHLYQALGKPLVLAEEVWSPGVSPLRIQHFDQDKMTKYLKGKVYPYVLRLAESPFPELKIGWPIVNVQPEKHTAYAVQWFAMALALLMLTVFANSNISAWFRGRSAGKTNE